MSPRSRAGITLIEVVVGVVIFAGLFLALMSASQQGLRLATRATSDLQVWGATQRVADSLIALDPADLSSGTATTGTVQHSWSAPDSSRVLLVTTYQRAMSAGTVVDTLTLYRN